MGSLKGSKFVEGVLQTIILTKAKVDFNSYNFTDCIYSKLDQTEKF